MATIPKANVYVVLLSFVLIAGLAAISIGSTRVEWLTSIRVIGGKLLPAWVSTGDTSQADQVIVWLIRVPRVILAAFVGAGLAVAGVLLQGLFRNALAEPNIVGVGSGAVLGAVIVFTTGLAVRFALALPLGAFCGALFAIVVVYALATRDGTTPLSTLLLSGIALAALLSAVSSLLISMSIVNWQVAQEIVFWMMGGLDSRSWTHVWLSAPFIVLGVLVSLYYGRDLDLLVQGEEAAAALGVDVEASKRVLILVSALLTGSCVAVAGVIGFVGLIVPHVIRLIIGPTHRRLLLSSALAGASFLIVCDLLARTLHPPTEIRLGIITAIFGAPFFLLLLVRKYREVSQ
jgi:iron complex transport system permease protein